MSKLLINEPPLMVLPSLAQAIGLNEAIFLQQLHYWLNNPEMGVIADNEKWLRNTIDQWRNTNFPFWGRNTIVRTVKSLSDRGIIKTRMDLNKKRYDKTKWYAIDYDAIPTTQNGLWVKEAITHFGSMEQPNMGYGPQPIMGRPIPENTIPENTITESAVVVEILKRIGTRITKPVKILLRKEWMTVEYVTGFLDAYESGFYDNARNPAAVIKTEMEAGEPPPAISNGATSGNNDRAELVKDVRKVWEALPGNGPNTRQACRQSKTIEKVVAEADLPLLQQHYDCEEIVNLLAGRVIVEPTKWSRG